MEDDPDVWEPNWYLWHSPDGRTFWGPSLVRMINEQFLENMLKDPDDK